MEVEKEYYILEKSGELIKLPGYQQSNQMALKQVAKNGQATIVITIKAKENVQLS